MLLNYLQRSLDVSGYGLEIDDNNIIHCLENEIDVIQSDLNEGLSRYFDDDSFDFVIMTQTLQAIKRPDQLLEDIVRVGREGIVTFPNMANWKNRLQLGLRGRMPISKTLPYSWYETPNIHLCTVNDFESLCAAKNIHILERKFMNAQRREQPMAELMPNVLSEIALYRFTLG